MTDESDRAKAAASRRGKRKEQLASSPVVEVSGVVGPTGACGAKTDREGPWTLQFSLAAWRIADGDLHKDALDVSRTATKEELRQLMASITAYGVVQIRARVAVDEPPGKSEALLEEFLGPIERDVELKQFADQLQKPVTYEDPVFGVLTLNRRIGFYSAKVDWNGRRVSLNVSATKGNLVAGLKTAHELWKNQEEWDQRIKEFAVLKLLPVKNNSWTNEQYAPVSAEQFRERMRLQGITVYSNDSFEFWHDDGDMFAGHLIEVSASLAGGPQRADLAG
jgi:hypothetical protein